MRHSFNQKVPLATQKSTLTLLLKVFAKTAMALLNSCLFLQNLLCRHWLYFWKIARRNSPNFEKLPAQGPKEIRFYGSYWRFAFLKKILWTRETWFSKRCKSFLLKIKESIDETQKPSITISVKNYHLLKKLFWKQKLRFWEPFLKKTIAKNRKAVRSKWKNNPKITLSLNDYFSSWQTEQIFDSSAEKILPKVSQYFFAQGPKLLGEGVVFLP